MGWYGDCSQDPNSTTGSCAPFEIKDEAKIKLVWEMSDGIKSFSSENPNYSPIQQMEAGKCYMIAVEAGDGSFDIPHLVTSGNGGYVSESCPIGNYFVTTEAYTLPYTTPVVDTGYGYYPVQYSPGDTVTLTANTRDGYQFQGWTSLSPFSLWSEVTDVSSPNISFTMPSEPVTVKLDYLDLTLDTDGDGIPDHEDDYPNQSTQIIDWADTDLSLLTVGDTADLKATAETDITYTISDSSIGTIDGNTITIVGDGEAVVTATAVASAQWFEASATTSFQTDADSDGDGILDSQDDDPYQQSQAIAWNDDLSDLNVGGTFTLTASAQTSVTYTSSDDSILSVSGNTATAVSSGVATVTATAGATSDYFSSTSTISVNIIDADSDGDGIPDSQDDSPYQQSQTIEWEDDLSSLTAGDTFTLTASAQTAVTYASSDTSIATISGNVLTLIAEGTVTITANSESSTDYFSATSTLSANVGVSATSYSITTTQSLTSTALTFSTNGSNVTSAIAGDTVTITVSLLSGYENLQLSGITVLTDAYSINPIEVDSTITSNSNVSATATFIMPSKDVDVSWTGGTSPISGETGYINLFGGFGNVTIGNRVSSLSATAGGQTYNMEDANHSTWTAMKRVGPFQPGQEVTINYTPTQTLTHWASQVWSDPQYVPTSDLFDSGESNTWIAGDGSGYAISGQTYQITFTYIGPASLVLHNLSTSQSSSISARSDYTDTLKLFTPDFSSGSLDWSLLTVMPMHGTPVKVKYEGTDGPFGYVSVGSTSHNVALLDSNQETIITHNGTRSDLHPSD